CFVGIFSDITQQKRSEDMIWRQAHYESLTGLPNSQHFHLKLQEAVDRAREGGGEPVAVVFLDLDLVKKVNNKPGQAVGGDLLRARELRGTLGHPVGVAWPCAVPDSIGAAVRRSGRVARLGGDEFALILEGIGDASVVDRILEDVLASLARPYLLSGQEGTV